MKIADTTGRELLVDLVYKDGKLGWVKASCYRLKGRSTIFTRVASGTEFAVRICSLGGADVLVFENGVPLLQATIDARTQILATNSEGAPLIFQNGASNGIVNGGAEPDQGATETNSAVLVPPRGEGLLFVVVRFAKHESPFGEPPQEEFPLSFQLMEPDVFAQHFANNFSLVEDAHALPNVRDEFIRDEVPEEPHTHCVFSGADH